ncbi:MAG: hypothetical protein ACJ8FT_01165 [Sphingomonas sp.]
MRLAIAAAFALAANSSLAAQPVPDLSFATPIAGNWSYAASSGGREASYADASGHPQLFVHCARATRRVTIAKPASAAAPMLGVWTSSETRSVAASFNSATGRLIIDLSANDALLDAIATSRGRIGFSVGAQPALVVPAWPEVARVIEDCRV